ncbi:FISUMP domain-containing protein [Chryseobacterium sp. ISL-6]|uniref:FISUMP domain-containing protein n=1 Tax=Chryseobacterium sp. ISL-6 TaxID=2819143 RepID=UPI001BEA7AB8|nr:FISUMP domain-containing protein [Chryseobacterium sp. ISL-6]MBT2623635.1 hypothetical protein [Chryseobacterium sp. ISL-6]
MKKLYLLPIVLIGALFYGQVGINNVDPKSTMDIQSKTTDGSTSEGFLLPRVTGNALHAAEAATVYGADQDATLTYVTDAPDPANRTGQVEGMDAPGFYYFNAGSNRWVKMLASGTNTAEVTQLSCSGATNIGVLESGKPAAGVNTVIPYTGGNGGIYSGESILSTGVTGLVAVLSSGTLHNGSGALNFSIVGTPSAAGTAVFTISMAGETCGFTRTVEPSGSFPNVVPVIINGQTRQMMTHNLGADTSLDPNVPVQAIMGNYYQWGKLNPVATAYTNANAISGWSTAVAADKSWNSGTEAVPIKTVKDPCPAGFRVPTWNEWSEFILSSTNSNIGTWADETNGVNNFSAGKVFMNNGSTLMLPTAGNRNKDNGKLEYRANETHYWSSTESNTTSRALYITVGSVSPSATNFRSRAYPLRCINE